MASMSRACALSIAIAAAATVVAAQGPDTTIVLLRDPSGAKVEGATGTHLGESQSNLVALRGSGCAERLGPAPTFLTARSDAKGQLRLTAPADRGPLAAGAVLVRSDAGLGALLPRARPGQAQVVQLQPMGEVTTPGGSETFTLWARAILPNGDGAPLPPETSERMRLPVGSYDVWAQSTDGWTWQRLTVRSKQRSLLSFAGPARRLHVRPEARVHPAGRPEIQLLPVGRELSLLGSALAAPLVTWVGERCLGELVVPSLATNDGLVWPPPPIGEQPTVQLIAPGAPRDAVLFSLSRTAAGSWQVLAAATASSGTFQLPPPTTGDAWLLLVGSEHAPTATPWAVGVVPKALAMQKGLPLQVSARDEQGLPIVDLAVDYTPNQMDAASVHGHSDGRGNAQLGRVLSPGLLRVSDARFANQELEVDAPGAGVVVTVHKGSELRGVAKWPDGKAARGVVITLRDPSGSLRPAHRAVASGDDGAFAFAGLRENQTLLLFASTQRDGRTWSAKLDRLRAGGEDVELVLHDEDPQLVPPTGR